MGGLAIKFCRQVEAFTLSFYPFPPKVDGSDLKDPVFQPAAGT